MAENVDQQQATAAEGTENSESMNALQENIAKRGNNAYYYAHGHRNDAPAWDGDAARTPRPFFFFSESAAARARPPPPDVPARARETENKL